MLCEFLATLLAAGPRWIDCGEISEALWGGEWQGDTARVMSVWTLRLRDRGIGVDVIPRHYGDYYGTQFRIPLSSRGGAWRISTAKLHPTGLAL